VERRRGRDHLGHGIVAAAVVLVVALMLAVALLGWFSTPSILRTGARERATQPPADAGEWFGSDELMGPRSLP
jgi:hypothetical protein